MAKTKTIVIDGNKLMAAFNQAEQLRLTHAVLLKETCTYSYSVRLENGDTDIMTNECGRQLHNDLRVAFRAFDSHLAVITEQIPVDDVMSIEDSTGTTEDATDNLVRHQVDEIKIFGNIENGSIVLSGTKILKSGDELKLKTPKVALDGGYHFVEELASALITLIDEVTQYHNGKTRPEPQLDLFENQDDERLQ